jgi:hypothetical protein
MNTIRLSEKQRASLYNAVIATQRGEWIEPFLSGSTTISTLKKHGLIAPLKVDGRTVYQATAAGFAYYGMEAA